MDQLREQRIRPGSFAPLIVGLFLVAGFAGCVSPEDSIDSDGPLAGTTEPDPPEPPVEPPETYGPLIEGTVFRYHDSIEDAWLNVTITDVNTTKRGQRTILVEKEWSSEGWTIQRSKIWINRTTFAWVEVRPESQPSLHASCPLHSVFPVETTTVHCQFYLGGSSYSNEKEARKVSKHEDVAVPMDHFSTIHTNWTLADGSGNSYDAWYSPDLGYYVKERSTQGWARSYTEPELVNVLYPDERPAT